MPTETEELAKEDTPITELTTLEATKVSGVPNPANGTPFLVLKARAPSLEDGGGGSQGGEEVAKNVDALSPEEIEALLTKSLCEDPECGVCKQRIEVWEA